MTNITDDCLLQNIFLDAAAEEYAAELSSIEKQTTSLRFQHQMKKMIQNPNKWAKQRKRPLWHIYIQKVAVFLLVCSVTLGAVMVASPTVRATIVDWVVEWYETHIVYRFFGKSELEGMPRYDITELPSGYKATGEILEMIDNVMVIYENEEGKEIYFDYSRTGEGSALAVNTENMEIYEAKVQNCSGHLYLSLDSQETNVIVWYDEQEKIQFMIDGFVNSDELLCMANSVLLCNTTK